MSTGGSPKKGFLANRVFLANWRGLLANESAIPFLDGHLPDPGDPSVKLVIVFEMGTGDPYLAPNLRNDRYWPDPFDIHSVCSTFEMT